MLLKLVTQDKNSMHVYLIIIIIIHVALTIANSSASRLPSLSKSERFQI